MASMFLPFRHRSTRPFAISVVDIHFPLEEIGAGAPVFIIHARSAAPLSLQKCNERYDK